MYRKRNRSRNRVGTEGRKFEAINAEHQHDAYGRCVRMHDLSSSL